MLGRKRVLDDDHDAISHFIWCVRKRPALYNYKLPPQQRRRVDVARIWQELADEIGNVTAAECRKKWKNLRDTYHQYRLRKLKYKECLEKWRYTTDLSFLTDIYQPKLKSERSKYLNSSQNNTIHEDEVKASNISSLIELDEETTQDQDSESITEHIVMDDEFEENIDHVIDMDEVQFCDVSEEKVKHVGVSDDTSYGEVHLYDESDSNVEIDTLVLATNDLDRKDNIIRESYISCKVLDRPSTERSTPPPSEHLTIGNTKDELDLFFQFLKTKIQKLPGVDITAIQIEFLNAVLRRESACALREPKSNAS